MRILLAKSSVTSVETAAATVFLALFPVDYGVSRANSSVQGTPRRW
jgi:hypothetical protein